MEFCGYTSGDLKAMFVLDELCFESPFRVSLRDLRRSAEEDGACVVLAWDGDVLAGFVIANITQVKGAQIGYITTLDVRQEWRGHRLGTELMKRSEELCRERGCVGMLLHVFVGNAAAMRLYERLGYEAVGQAKNFYALGVGAVICRKAL